MGFSTQTCIYEAISNMSMISFALMKPYAPKYSIHYDDGIDAEESGELCPSSDDEVENGPPSDPKNAHKVYRYVTKDAIVNRATFLVVVGLVIIFSICVARDGAIDNMEWLRKQLTVDYVLIEKNRGDVMFMSNLVNHGGRMVPMVLVIGIDDSDDDYGVILSYLSPKFKSMGLNTTAVLWGKNSTYPKEQCTYDNGDWDLLTMSSLNATSLEYLINYLTEIMKVSVFYLDADDISKDMVSSSFSLDMYSLFPPSGASEDILISKYRWLPPTISYPGQNGSITKVDLIQDQPRDDILQPPLVPLIDPAIMVVWYTQPSVNLFRDAAAWQHSVEVHQKEEKIPQKSPATSFVLNMLLNDGRHVQPETVWGLGSGGNERIAEDVLKFRIYDGWGSLSQSLDRPPLPSPSTQKCSIMGYLCCLH